ncbi:YcnI family copper-binding membrane protein [Paenibacillus sp. 598K]|uniref:YcnI family copper-binding membrane protein n=1 Tax=Paenibacillus sp. 598K TaxID=1117987 RepID=UPI0021A98F81|nr:YcnI family protein [Paenibacillus sp. 598K]
MSRRRISVSILLTAVTLLLWASVASAHVTVQPQEVARGSYEVFTVRVPSETKDTHTVEVRVAVPDGVNITRTEPKPGWTTELEREDNRIVSVAWKAEGEGLADTEFAEFRMQGRVADDATELVWRAYQTYADGSLAEWIGAPDTGSPMPASLTKVVEGAAQSDGHSHGGASTDAGTPAGESPANAGEASGNADAAAGETPEQGSELAGTSNFSKVTLGIAILAVVLAALALLVVMMRGRKA